MPLILSLIELLKALAHLVLVIIFVPQLTSESESLLREPARYKIPEHPIVVIGTSLH
jgi:hypothetical protein